MVASEACDPWRTALVAASEIASVTSLNATSVSPRRVAIAVTSERMIPTLCRDEGSCVSNGSVVWNNL
jgi:hypothetical protein